MYKFKVFLKSGEAVGVIADKCNVEDGVIMLMVPDVDGPLPNFAVAVFAAGAWTHFTSEKVAK